MLLSFANLAYSAPGIFSTSLYPSIYKNFGYFPSISYNPIRIPLSYSHQYLPYLSYSNYLQPQYLYQIPTIPNYIQPFTNSYLPSFDPYTFWWNYALKNPWHITVPKIPQHTIPTISAPTVPTTPITVTPEKPVVPETHEVTETKPVLEQDPVAPEHTKDDIVKDETPIVHELGAGAKVENVPPFIQ